MGRKSRFSGRVTGGRTPTLAEYRQSDGDDESYSEDYKAWLKRAEARAEGRS